MVLLRKGIFVTSKAHAVKRGELSRQCWKVQRNTRSCLHAQVWWRARLQVCEVFATKNYHGSWSNTSYVDHSEH